MKKENVSMAVDRLKDALVKTYGPAVQVIMFGSAARGDCDSDSDIDILVLLSGFVNTQVEEEVFSIAYDIELAYDVVFGTIVYSKEYWESDMAGAMPLHENIAREGIAV